MNNDMTPTREQLIEMAKRVWREIPSFTQYEVSNDGLVRRGERLLTIGLTAKGYPRVSLSNNGKSHTTTVHKLVLEAFVGPRQVELQCCHNNGIKTDNRIENLRYDTTAENHKDKQLHGTLPVGRRNGMNTHPERRSVGSKHGLSKLTEEDVLRIRELCATAKRGDKKRIAQEYGVHPTLITQISKGLIWKTV